MLNISRHRNNVFPLLVSSASASTVAETPESRIFYISSFPSSSNSRRQDNFLQPFVGMERHKCSIVQLEMHKLIYFALLAEGFPATEELNDVSNIIL